jgi:hypothetical protein
MVMKNWHGILRIIDIQHLDAQNRILWESHNIYNLLHYDGEEFMLRAAFTGGRISTIVPDNYYLGLDNRSGVAVANTMDDLVGEPSGRGYERQAVSSSGDFAVNFEQGHHVATSPIVAFRSTTASWGPVGNLFVTDKSDNTGYLIATAILPSGIIVETGQSITMRIGMQLRPC